MGGEMSLFGDIAGYIGSEDAEDAQYAADREAQGRIERGIKNYDPYMQNFSGAAGALGRLYGTDGLPADLSGFTASPAYQFRVGEGQKAIERSAAAKGGLYSGAAGKALTDYGQSAASQEFDNYVSRLFGISDRGMNAAGSVGNLLTGQSAIDQQIGDNQGNAKISQANAIGSMFDQAAAAAMGGMQPGGGFSGMNAAQMFFGG